MPTAPTIGTAPDLNSYLSKVTPQQVQEYIKANQVLDYQNGKGRATYKGVGGGGTVVGKDVWGTYVNDPSIQAAVKQHLATQQYQPVLDSYNQQTQQAKDTYNKELGNYNLFNNFLQTSGFTPQQMAIAAASNKGLFGGQQ